MIEDTVTTAMARYSWYHSIEVEPGLQTPGLKIIEPIQRPILTALRSFDLKGKRFLDIGCRDGLFSFEAEKMGASDILGIDNDLSIGAVEFLIPLLKSRVKMQSANLYDFRVSESERFDFVLFAGVLYHLRLPFLGLKRISELMNPNATLLLETAMWATQQPQALLYRPAPTDSPYELTSVTFYNNAGLVAALESFGFSNIECRHVLSDDGTVHDSWDAFLASSYFPKADDKVRVARAIYTASRSARDERLDKYWYRTHSLNSVHADNKSFLRGTKFQRTRSEPGS